MAVSSVALDFSQPLPQAETEAESWYGLHTRPRHEKMVAQRLEERGVTTFLPLITEVHRWSDRKKTVQMPLFSCYVFAKFMPNRAERLRVLRVDGVFGLVGARGEGTPIPDAQIDAVRSLVETELPWSSHPFLKIGQRVRIRSGALDGMEGILLSRNGDQTLVISDRSDPTIACGARRRIRSRTCLKLFSEIIPILQRKDLPPMSPHTIETLRLLVVSSEVSVLRLLGSTAQSNSWHLETSASGWDAMERVQSDTAPHLLLLDLPRGDGEVCISCRGCAGFAPNFRSLCFAIPRSRPAKRSDPHGREGCSGCVPLPRNKSNPWFADISDRRTIVRRRR